MLKKNKEKDNTKSNMTPEQQEKAKKIAVIGMIALSILVAALIITVIVVGIKARGDKGEEKENPLKDLKAETLTVDQFEKLVDDQNLSQSNEFRKKTAHILIHNDEISDDLINVAKEIDKKENKDFGFLLVHFSTSAEKDKLVKLLTKFTKMSEGVLEEEENDLSEEIKNKIESLKEQKSFLCSILDTTNFENFTTSKEKGSIIQEESKIIEELNKLK